MEDIIQRVRNLPATPTTISPTTFADEDEAEQMASTSTDRDRIASLNAESMLAVRGGERFQLALPAYEKFTTDGTGGNTETFSLSHSVMQTPNTENIVVWEGSQYLGNEPVLDAVDYDANTFDYTDDGTSNTLHVYYISDAAADLEIQKVSTSGNSYQGLYDESLRLVHQTNQSEQPETPDVNSTDLNPVVPSEFEIEVYLDAPYTFRWTDADGDGTSPTNLLFSFPVNRGRGQIPGLRDAVAADMASQ